MKTKLEEISKSLDGLRAMVDSVLSELEAKEAPKPQTWILKVRFPGGGYEEKVFKTEAAARESEYFIPKGLETEVFQLADLDCLARGFEMDKKEDPKDNPYLNPNAHAAWYKRIEDLKKENGSERGLIDTLSATEMQKQIAEEKLKNQPCVKETKGWKDLTDEEIENVLGLWPTTRATILAVQQLLRDKNYGY